jgi:hypothetical protein
MNKKFIALAAGAGAVTLVIVATRKASAKPDPGEDGTLAISVTPANAVLLLDGEPILAGIYTLPAGSHTWVAAAAGYAQQSETVTIYPGVRATLDIVLSTGDMVPHEFNVGNVIRQVAFPTRQWIVNAVNLDTYKYTLYNLDGSLNGVYDISYTDNLCEKVV